MYNQENQISNQPKILELQLSTRFCFVFVVIILPNIAGSKRRHSEQTLQVQYNALTGI